MAETDEQKGKNALSVNGALIGVATLFGIICIALPASGLPVFSIGVIPFMIIAAGMIAVGLVTVIARVPIDVVGEIAVAVGTIGMIVLCVLLFISHVCLRIRPIELFVSGSPATSFLDGLAKAEASVCKLVDDTNNYIQADVGPPGISTPELVTVAQQKAVAAVPGPIVTCPPPTSDNKESLTPIQRLERLEMTLSQFVEPEFKSSCVKAGVCMAGEGFEDGSDGSDTDPVVLQRRLDAVNAKVKTLTVTYLDPMKKKQEDLQKGQASDSDKQKGAAAAVPGSGSPSS